MIYDTNPIGFNNTLKDIPADKLPDDALQDSLNIIYNDGSIESRYGITPLGLGSLPLNSAITGVADYRLMRDTDKYFIAFTKTDAYIYNQKKLRFEFRTRNYNKGTVTTSGTGYKTVSLASPVTPTGTITHNSKKVTVSSATGLNTGMYITGDGIPEDTTITGISSTILTLSKDVNKLMSFTGVLTLSSVTVATVSSTSGLAVGMPITGKGDIVGSVVKDSPLVTLVNASYITGLAEGKAVSGTGVPAGAKIQSVNGNTVTLTVNCTSTVFNIILTIEDAYASVIPPGTTIATIGSGTITLSNKAYTPTAKTGTWLISTNLITLNDMTGIKVGQSVTGTGIPASTYIQAVNGYIITITNNATAAGTAAALTIADVTAVTFESPASGLSGVNLSVAIAAWKNARWTQTSLYQISFDSATLENCTTWYTVQSITSAYQLTLAEDAVTKTNSVYCLRLCYNGDEDDLWHTCTPYSPEDNDICILATNGIDRVQYWNGEGYFDDFPNYPNLCKYLGYFGSVGYSHILYANLYDTGSAQYFESTIEIGDAGTLTFNGTYFELLDSNSEIMGIMPLNTQLIIYKKNTISIAQVNPNGGNTDPFSVREDVVVNIGTPAIRTVQNLGSKHIVYTGKDIIEFNGYDHASIATGNIKYIMKNVNKNYEHRAFSFLIQELSLYCLMLPFGVSTYPNICLVYNYQSKAWTYWQFNNLNNSTLMALCSGLFKKSYSPRWCDLYVHPTGTWSNGSNQITLSSTTEVEEGMRIKGTGITDVSYITDLTGSVATIDHNTTQAGSSTALTIGWTAAQMNQRWSDLIVNDNFDRLLFADSTGYIYEFHKDNLTDAGNLIYSSWTSKDFNVNRPGCDFQLLALTLNMQLKESQAAYIRVRASVNAGRSWTAWSTVQLDGNETYMEKIVNYHAVGKTVRFEFQTSTPLIFESIRIKVNGEYQSFKFDE